MKDQALRYLQDFSTMQKMCIRMARIRVNQLRMAQCGP